MTNEPGVTLAGCAIIASTFRMNDELNVPHGNKFGGQSGEAQSQRDLWVSYVDGRLCKSVTIWQVESTYA